MRVLFTVNPEKAHYFAMVPLAWALRTAGHEVRVASQPRFADEITQSGLTAVPVGRDTNLWELIPRHDDYRDWTWEPTYGLDDHVPYDVVEYPERATGAHVVGVLHLEDRRAGDADDDRERDRAERDRRQDQVEDRIPCGVELTRQDAVQNVEAGGMGGIDARILPAV